MFDPPKHRKGGGSKNGSNNGPGSRDATDPTKTGKGKKGTRGGTAVGGSKLAMAKTGAEQQTLAAWLKSGGGCPSDFNGDGVVDFLDFLLFAAAFGGSNPTFDIDGSGAVDFPDFLQFASDFGQKCS